MRNGELRNEDLNVTEVVRQTPSGKRSPLGVAGIVVFLGAVGVVLDALVTGAGRSLTSEVGPRASDWLKLLLMLVLGGAIWNMRTRSRLLTRLPRYAHLLAGIALACRVAVLWMTHESWSSPVHLVLQLLVWPALVYLLLLNVGDAREDPRSA